MGILDSISSPEDVRKLSAAALSELCREIRLFLIENISKTGGHLSSNLGIVELTVALHRVYDTSTDRLIFDVGHQCYVHKILTGRREGFSKLRQMGGVSGFPKPAESVHDAFIAGHASNSVSVALGMARAGRLQARDNSVVAVIGDGALTGGLAFEGLSNAGDSGENLCVILNDNGMSIDKNVGGAATMLSKLRVRPGYISFKNAYKTITSKIPPLYRISRRLKSLLKGALFPSSFFEELGFYYIGPIDGHNIEEIESALRFAKSMRCPTLVHVITTKGKGYRYAEESPERFHGVSAFDVTTGEADPQKADFSSAFGEAAVNLAQSNEKVVAITAAMEFGTGLSDFAQKFPDRFFDVGITEGHAVAMAAGMAKEGLLPIFAVYSSFFQRSYDMLIHDVSLLGIHAVFAVDRCGLSGGDGETHHGVFDVAFLTSVPGMTVLCPSSFAELREMLSLAAYKYGGPVAVRYPRGHEGEYTGNCGAEAASVLTDGGDVTIVSYGTMINMALKAAEILRGHGIMSEVVKLNRLSPLDCSAVAKSAVKTARLVVIEDVCAASCAGARISAELLREGILPESVALFNLGDGIVQQGATEELLALKGISPEAVVSAVLEMPGLDEVRIEKMSS